MFDKIEINGREYDLKFGNSSMRRLGAELDLNVFEYFFSKGREAEQGKTDQIGIDLTHQQLEYVLYCSLVKCDLTFDEFEEGLDLAEWTPMDVLLTATELMKMAFPQKKTLKPKMKIPKGDSKK